MEQINLPEFLSLFGCTNVDDYRLGADWLDANCTIDESGITIKYSDNGFLGYDPGIKLCWPCTAQDLFYWSKDIEKQAYFVKLPTWFVDKWLPNYMLFKAWCSQTDTVKGVGTDKPFDVDWEYWLNIPEKWTKKEAALLIYGLEPNQFKQVDINENDLAMCELLYKLLLLPDDLKLPPCDWLNLLYKKEYLELAQPLREKIGGRCYRYDSNQCDEEINKKREEKEKRERDEAGWQLVDKPTSQQSEAFIVDPFDFDYGLTQVLLGKLTSPISKKDWQAMLTLPEWTPGQAICLAYGINPFDYGKIEGNKRIETLECQAKFKGNMTPYQWQQFFNGMKLPLPQSIENSSAGSQAATEPANTKGVPENTTPNEREVKQGLRDIWTKEGNPGGTVFFNKLKGYVGKPGSPVIEHFSAGGSAGIRWETSAGTRGEMKKKTILNIVATFKNTP